MPAGMQLVLPFLFLTAALVLLTADALPVVRAGEECVGWSLAATVSSTMRRGLHSRNIIVLEANGGRGRGVR